MRVALVTHYMPPHVGGVEQVAAETARVYREAGHDVDWVASAPPHEPGTTLEGGVRLVRLASSDLLDRRFGMPYPVPYPRERAALDAVVKRAEVVHVHDCLYATSLWADAAARRFDRRMIVTQHVALVPFADGAAGGLIELALVAAYRTFGRRLLRHAVRLSFVSPLVRDWFREHIDGSLDGPVIRGAVDTSRFRPASPPQRVSARRTLSLPADGFVVLFAGRLVANKRLPLLIEAMRLLPGAHLLVVGDGPTRDALRGLPGRVSHFASLPHARMPEVYAAADVFVLPSKSEASPLSLAEAMATGLACVVSTDLGFRGSGGSDEVVVTEPQAAALASALDRLGRDPAARDRLGGAARAWAVAELGREAFAERTLALLASATEDR